MALKKLVLVVVSVAVVSTSVFAGALDTLLALNANVSSQLDGTRALVARKPNYGSRPGARWHRGHCSGPLCPPRQRRIARHHRTPFVRYHRGKCSGRGCGYHVYRGKLHKGRHNHKGVMRW